MSTSRTYVAGAVLTAAQVNDLPQGRLGHALVTATQGAITSPAIDLTGATATVTVVAGRTLKVTGDVFVQSTVTDDTVGLFIMEGATQLQRRDVPLRLSNLPGAVHAEAIVVAPSAGAHTYKLQVGRTNGTGTISTVHSATIPGLILVEDIGV